MGTGQAPLMFHRCGPALALVLIACAEPHSQPWQCFNGFGSAQDADEDGLFGCDDPDCADVVFCDRQVLFPSEDFSWLDLARARHWPPRPKDRPEAEWTHQWRLLTGGVHLGGDVDADGLSDAGVSVWGDWDEPGDGEPAPQAETWTVLALSSHGPAPFGEGPLRFGGIRTTSGFAPEAETRCDLNGDGWQDLAVNDLLGTDVAEAGLSVIFGGPHLQDPNVAPEVLFFPNPSTRSGSLVCVGDLDGDGRDELALELAGTGVAILDLDAPHAATSVSDLVHRWTWGSKLWRHGPVDMDTDGRNDLFIGPYDDTIQPGTTRTFIQWGGPYWVPADPEGKEVLETPATDLREPRHKGWVEGMNLVVLSVPTDLDGDGLLDIASDGPLGMHIVPGDRIPRSGAVDLEPEELVGWIDLRTRREGDDASTPRGTSGPEDETGEEYLSRLGAYLWTALDTNDDGHKDLIFRVPSRYQCAGRYTLGGCEDGEAEIYSGLFVFLGDGTLEGFTRSWEDADLFLGATNYRPFFTAVADADADGDGVDDLPMAWNGTYADTGDVPMFGYITSTMLREALAEVGR